MEKKVRSTQQQQWQQYNRQSKIPNWFYRRRNTNDESASKKSHRHHLYDGRCTYTDNSLGQRFNWLWCTPFYRKIHRCRSIFFGLVSLSLSHVSQSVTCSFIHSLDWVSQCIRIPIKLKNIFLDWRFIMTIEIQSTGYFVWFDVVCFCLFFFCWKEQRQKLNERKKGINMATTISIMKFE